LPSNISYSILEIEAPNGRKLGIPRRELFDVRVQLMAEDGGDESDDLAALDKSDIKTNVYEGGFKSWECSIDLAKLLLARGPRKDLEDLYRVHHVLEVSPDLVDTSAQSLTNDARPRWVAAPGYPP
jgi:protein-histidine N-methyltransferase